ncbi:hypothetical protein D3C81_506030 [compost metagenome]
MRRPGKFESRLFALACNKYDMDYHTAYAAFSARLLTVKGLQEKANGDKYLQDDEFDLLFESLFMSVFRAFENFIEDCFICSLQGMPDMSGKSIARFAQPDDRRHARDMLLGAQTVLDWTSTTVIVRRYETFLKDKDSGLYLGVSDVANILTTAKDLRNHIAHNSDESGLKYKRVVANFFPTPPLGDLSPGSLLRTTPKVGPAKGAQVLTYFRSRLWQAAKAVAGAP